MPSIALEPALAANRLMPRLWVFVWLGLGSLILGLILNEVTASLLFTTSSATFFAIALMVIGLNRKYLTSSRHFHESLNFFVHCDAAPTVFVSSDGEIAYQNRAALDRFGDASGQTLVAILAGLCSNPTHLISVLSSKANISRSACRDIATPRGHLRLSVHQIPAHGCVWRFEGLTELSSDTDASAPSISVPMLLANENGKILFTNPALRNLLGREVAHLDRVFDPFPLLDGPFHYVATASGRKALRVVEHQRDLGRREIFLIETNPDEATDEKTGRLFDDLPVALVRLSTTGVVINANRQARRLLDYKSGAEVRLSDLVRGLGRPINDWLRDAAEGRAENQPQVVQTGDKTYDVYLQIALSRIVEKGDVSLMAVLNDATELKSLEAQFVQSQKMQAIGQLAGGVAHDFNNLLTAISGYCDLLLLRHDEGDPDFGDLIQINQNANRAASLVSQLLAFSRKQNLQPETLDLRDTLSELSHLLNRLLGEKVTLNLQSDVSLARVRADKRQLEQVLMNLVVNARDAMQGGGEVRLETETVVLVEDMLRDRATVAKGRYVSIKVSDTGTGIPAAQIRKIFEPFYTTKQTGEGTGLGLSMVYGIVKQTGGFIFVDSAVGQGTSFQILLPAYDAPEIPVKTKAAIAPPIRGQKEDGVVLLVEDEAPVRAFAARALAMRGYKVLEACDADAALLILEDQSLSVDVFVTDVVMPGKDGPTWVKEALVARPDVKVVFVSGYAEESFADQQADIANSVFLPKPFSLTDLTEKVRAQLIQ